MQPRNSEIAAVFDTETTSLPDGRACVWAFIWKPRGENVEILRDVVDVLARIDLLARKALRAARTQIIAVYNLKFDTCGILPLLEQAGFTYEIFEASGRWLALDIFLAGVNTAEHEPLVRFWDTQPLVPDGLAVMGELCGVPKRVGDLDYKQLRSPLTPYTDEERAYMEADVIILETFLENLIEWHDWLNWGDLGRNALTNASIARLFMRRKAGAQRLGTWTASQEFLRATNGLRSRASDEQERLRRHAYAGGYTFLNPATAWQTLENVQHFDIDSAYHFTTAFSDVPVRFVEAHKSVREQLTGRLTIIAEAVRESAHAGDYSFINNPCGGMRFHARVTLENITLRDDWPNFGYIAAARVNAHALKIVNASGAESGKAEAAAPVVEFSRITAAERLTITVDENEFAALALVYEWTALTVERAEICTKSERLALPQIATARLRAEKQSRKAAGGAQYDYFKRIYNATAGIYAQAAGASARHSYSCLPLAVRQTAQTRLFLAASVHALYNAGHAVLSGDTDSIKVQANAHAADAPAAILAELSALRERPAPPENLHIPPDIYETLGTWQHERTAAFHRELQPKARAWYEGGKFIIKMSGSRTRKLAEWLTAHHKTTHKTARACLEYLQPYTWIDTRITSEVTATPPQAGGLQFFTFADRDGQEFDGLAVEATHLANVPMCISSPIGYNRIERLLLAAKLENLEEGHIDYLEGYKPYE